MAEVFSDNGIRIVQGDFLTTSYISDNSIDLIVTSDMYSFAIFKPVVKSSEYYIEIYLLAY